MCASDVPVVRRGRDMHIIYWVTVGERDKMASSQIMNGKQRDRIASYAMNNSYRSNYTAANNATGNAAAGPSIQANQQQRRKKSYRARGCRGGASRKNSSRKKNLDSTDEENDSTVLNNNIEIKHSANKNMSKSRSYKTGTLSILPKEEFKHLPPLRSDAVDDSDKPILPSRDIRENLIATHRTRTRNVQSVIARPSANGKSNAVSQMGGFSFFSISPRSFLTGMKTSTPFKAE